MTDSYSLFLKPSVEQDLRRIPKKELQRIDSRLLGLVENPRPPGCERLVGANHYRLRQGNYRIIYAVDDEQKAVFVVRVQHRRDVYRK